MSSCFVFFFKQKTAYEMRISDWSSDVCSSDLDSGCDAVGLDWTANLNQVRQRLGDSVALQGNLDPMAMFGGEAAIRAQARKVIDDFGVIGNGGHVFNLGHGISRFTPPAAVQVLVDAVHTYSRSKQYFCLQTRGKTLRSEERRVG